VSFDLLRARPLLVGRGRSGGLGLTLSASRGSIDLPVLVAGAGARNFGQQASTARRRRVSDGALGAKNGSR